jgi:hypothetical protein
MPGAVKIQTELRTDVREIASGRTKASCGNRELENISETE